MQVGSQNQNMLSQRLFRILDLLLRSTSTLQVCAMTFDKKKCLVYTNTNWKIQRNIYANLVLAICWFVGAFIQIFYFYKKKDADRMNLTLAFIMGALIFLTVSTITACYPTSCCRITNGLFQLLRYLQSKTLI